MTSLRQIIIAILLILLLQISSARAIDACTSPGCQSIWLFYMKLWSHAPAVSCFEQVVDDRRYVRCRPTLSTASGHLWAIGDRKKHAHEVHPVNGKAIGITDQGYTLPQPNYPIMVSISEPLEVESIPHIIEQFDK